MARHRTAGLLLAALAASCLAAGAAASFAPPHAGLSLPSADVLTNAAAGKLAAAQGAANSAVATANSHLAAAQEAVKLARAAAEAAAAAKVAALNRGIASANGALGNPDGVLQNAFDAANAKVSQLGSAANAAIAAVNAKLAAARGAVAPVAGASHAALDSVLAAKSAALNQAAAATTGYANAAVGALNGHVANVTGLANGAVGTLNGKLASAVAAGNALLAPVNAKAAAAGGLLTNAAGAANAKLVAPAQAAVNAKITLVNGKIAAVEKAIDAAAAPAKAHLNATLVAKAKLLDAAAAPVAAAAASHFNRTVDSINRAATSAAAAARPVYATVANKTAPAKGAASAAFTTGVGAVAGGVSKVTGALGGAHDAVTAKLAPVTGKLNATAKPVFSRINQTVHSGASAAFKTADALRAQSEPIRANTIGKVTGAVGTLAGLALRTALQTVQGPGEGLVKTVNHMDKVFAPANQALDELAAPFEEAYNSTRAAIKGAINNVTAPAKELRDKVLPLPRMPPYDQLFGSIFSNLPAPRPRNITLDPPRPYDPVWPTKINDPTGAPSGTCKPFEIPAPYTTILDYCEAMRHKPREYFTELYTKATLKAGEPFPMSGCVFGCIVGNDSFTQTQREFAAGFGWSGKCFSEERDADGVPKRFGSMLQRDYQLLHGKTQKERVTSFEGVAKFIFGGNGSRVEEGFFDKKPAFHFTDDPVDPRLLTAGGWRTLYSFFQAVGDGVIDEFRPLAPGVMIGKSFYNRPQHVLPDRWRHRTDTNFFLLFQSCTADGKIAWRPEDRDVPLVGHP